MRANLNTVAEYGGLPGAPAFVRLCMLAFVRISDVGICPTTFLLCWHLSD